MDAVSFAMQATFIALFVFSLLSWARRRDATRRDVALMFGSLGVPVALGMTANALGTRPVWLAVASAMGIVAQPYLTLRLFDRFRPVDRRAKLAALGGLVLSWILLVAFPTDRPAGATLPIIIAFAAVNGYAAWTFLRGALQVRGVSRRRIQSAALAIGLLGLAVAFAGVLLLAPWLAPVVRPSTMVAAAGAAVAFYVAFATPRLLRRFWQLEEYHAFSRSIAELGPRDRLSVTTSRLIEAGIASADGEAARVIIANRGGLLVHDGLSARPARMANAQTGLVAHAMRSRAPLIEDASSSLIDDSDRAILDLGTCRTVVVVPVMTSERVWGALVVASRAELLFPEDDLDLLRLMAGQLAYALENAEANEQLARRAEELARSNAHLEQFAYVASHDLREPLRMVSSFVSLLEKKYAGKLDADAQTYIRFAVDGASRMQDLVDGILEYARVGGASKVEPVALDELVDQTRRNLAAMIAESKGVVESSPLPVVKGDRTQLAQVVQNLVANGLKFHRPGEPPHVRVAAAEEEDRWIVRVSDDGIGIDPHQRDQIFLLFRRLHPREAYAGNGIGLAVSQKIIRQAGGDLWVESVPGRGSTFSFSIPKEVPA